MSPASLTHSEIDPRIVFHHDDQIMEVSFANLALTNSADVNAFYDRIEERIVESGETLWFFLVDYRESRVDESVWFTYSRRGRVLNKAHSMGSVRYDASDITRSQIEKDAGTEAFDPNLFADRDSAFARLRSMPTQRRAKIVHKPSFSRSDLNWRIEFLFRDSIMDVDFSNMSFEHSRDVNDVYDFIEQQIGGTGQKWYFLINYEGTRIQSAAWVQYAKRGKGLNMEWSLGSVRYAPGSETTTDIRMRAESQEFRPNIRNTRAEALERIDEMKAEAHSENH
ncbi:MAG: hypothetical protein DRQ98_13350 [Gammaproteobacteria bacterium]|nr:MAG: hypothetical protein DRQ98_13350 [Gammaproteobacteria bacterium]